MSLYLQDDTGTQLHLASNLGWGDFCRWVDGLDAKQFPQLVTLVEHGHTDKPEQLRAELNAALTAFPPHPDVVGVAETILKGLNNAAAVVMVTDGTQPEGAENEQN